MLTTLRRLADRYLPRGALLLATLTLATYALGLLRDRLFARTFGLSHDLDTYNAAFVLPELALDVLIASGLTAPFVPIFLGLRDNAGRDAAEQFGQSILTLAVLLMAVASAVLFVVAPLTADVVAPGFGPAQREQYTGLFRVMLVTPVVFAASIALGEVLVAERRFLWYGLAPLLYNGGLVFGAAVLSPRLGIYGPAWGAVLGAIAHLAVRLIGTRRAGFPIRPRVGVTPAVREFGRLMLPKMASQPIEPVTFLVFTSLATTVGTGAVSAISFARNFQSLPVSLIGIAFSVAAFPTLAAAVADRDRARFTALVRRDALSIGALSIAATAGLLVLGGLLIRVFLGGGAFGEADAATTTLALAVFALSIPFESLLYLFSRAIYATRNTLLAVLANLAGFMVTVVVGYALVDAAGIVAIPLAFTVGTGVKVALLVVALAARVRAIETLPPETVSEVPSAPPR